MDTGAFADQIVPVFATSTATTCALLPTKGIRRGTTAEKLAGLKPAFNDDGVIHAGNSSQISDGAAALLVMTSGPRPRAGPDPDRPVPQRRGGRGRPGAHADRPDPGHREAAEASPACRLDEIGVFEVNEAFAPVPLAWLAETGADPELLNPLGGAIALGHPLGASGAMPDDPHGRITCATTGFATACRPCARAAAPPTPRSSSSWPRT